MTTGPFSHQGDVTGDMLGAIGVLHALGLDPLNPDSAALENALPKGTRPILRWRLPDKLKDDPGLLDNYPEAPLLKVAELLGKPGIFRIELRDVPAWQKPEWFVKTIGEATRICPRSAYVCIGTLSRSVVWQWPLRVGFFDDGASQHAFRDFRDLQASEGGWMKKTVTLVEPTETPRQCGIIVVPSLEEARKRLSDVEKPSLRCGLLLILNWGGGSDLMDAAADTAEELLEDSWMSGVAVVDVDPRSSADLFFDVVRNLSHNEGIDHSLVAACRNAGFPYPFVSGTTALMRDSRLRRVMGSVRRKMENPSLGGSDLEFAPGSDVEMKFPAATRSVTGNRSMGDFSEQLRSLELDDNIFQHEGDFSTAMAEASEAMEESMAKAKMAMDEQQPRRLHCTVFGEQGEALKEWFHPGKKHEIEVGIGQPPHEAIPQDVVIPFPDDELPPDQDEYKLSVVFCKLSGDGIPKEGGVDLEAKTITLPRGNGNSTTVRFSFEVGADEEKFEGRLIVLFGDKILQTGRLSGAVGEAAVAGRYARIRFEIEALVSRYFSALEDEDRTSFEHALLFNDNPDGNPGLTAASGGSVKVSAPEGLGDQVDRLNKLVSAMAHDADTYTGTLDANPDLLKFMIAFARDGADLRSMVESSIPASSSFDTRKPIQLLTKTMGKKIPIEFFYDYEAPKTDATLCPGGLEFLSNGVCPHGDQHSRDVFCPSGFWGLNRVIERHEYSADEPDTGFVLKNEITETRRTLPIGDQALFAGTQVVDNSLGSENGLAKIKAQLDELTEGRCVQASSWEEWESTVGNEAPGLLVLVVHTEFGPLPFKEQQMEIGDDKWLLYNDIRPDLISGGADSGPVVFLIGCKTGAADIEYKDLSGKFKREGASVVISSSATIHSKHAVPVLARLVELLGNRAERREGFPLGEVMRAMRRQMLADGIPIILCITAYGDADWHLT